MRRRTGIHMPLADARTVAVTMSTSLSGNPAVRPLLVHLIRCLQNTSANILKVRYFTRAEVAEHSFIDDAWIVLHGHVYNITPWIPQHPGGNIILSVRTKLH